MPSLQLNAIATRVLLDESFQQAVLTGDCRDCLADFQLTDQERVAILTIGPRDPFEFIHDLYSLMRHTGAILPVSVLEVNAPLAEASASLPSPDQSDFTNDCSGLKSGPNLALESLERGWSSY